MENTAKNKDPGVTSPPTVFTLDSLIYNKEGFAPCPDIDGQSQITDNNEIINLLLSLGELPITNMFHSKFRACMTDGIERTWETIYFQFLRDYDLSSEYSRHTQMKIQGKLFDGKGVTTCDILPRINFAEALPCSGNLLFHPDPRQLSEYVPIFLAELSHYFSKNPFSVPEISRKKKKEEKNREDSKKDPEKAFTPYEKISLESLLQESYERDYAEFVQQDFMRINIRSYFTAQYSYFEDIYDTSDYADKNSKNRAENASKMLNELADSVFLIQHDMDEQLLSGCSQSEKIDALSSLTVGNMLCWSADALKYEYYEGTHPAVGTPLSQANQCRRKIGYQVVRNILYNSILSVTREAKAIKGGLF